MKVYLLTKYDEYEIVLECFTLIDKAKDHLTNLLHLNTLQWENRIMSDDRIVAFTRVSLSEYYIYELELK